MSDAYEISGVKITPTGGGWYELTHNSLAEPEKVQGKETADARAAAIAKAAEEGGSIPPQGDLPAAPVDLSGAKTDDQIADEKAASAKADADRAKDDEIAALKAKLAETEADRTKLQDAVAKVTTVVAEGAPADNQVPLSVPREFSGQMDSKTKTALGKMGVNVTTIVLEESEHIPPTGLFIGHNGRSYMISPGEPVDVPDFLLGVLDDAVMSAPVTDSKTQKVLGYRNRSKYPYRRV